MQSDTHTDKEVPLHTNPSLPSYLQGPRYVEHPSRFTVYIIYNLINIFMGTLLAAFTPIGKVLVAVG